MLGGTTNDYTASQMAYLRSLYTSRLAATLLTSFGLLALLLAAVGLHSVMTYAVNRRGREIGIRLARGTQGHEVRRLVMVEGSTMVGIGLALGLAGALEGAAGATRPVTAPYQECA